MEKLRNNHQFFLSYIKLSWKVWVQLQHETDCDGIPNNSNILWRQKLVLSKITPDKV